ncbi:MAG: glycosyltransferase family 4 protein [Candidatus Acidiferrales bacterium]
MKAQGRLERAGVALLATRMSVLGEDPCGGSEVVLWEDAAILEKAGIPVRVYGCAACKGSAVRILPVHTRAPLITSIEYAGQFLRKEREALIVAYNEPSLGGWAPERTIVRFDWDTALPRYWNWPLWISRFRRARYLFPSESEKQSFVIKYARIPADRISVISNAVDLRTFCPANGGPTNGQTDALRVGFAGQWVPRKGVADLLEAWAEVKSKVSSAELLLAGGPGLWKATAETEGAVACTARVRSMAEEGRLQAVGALARTQMPKFWNSLTIAVVPSRYEPFGLVALEAMACGVPMVATAVGGLQEIIHDGESGLLVPPKDPGALAQALIALLTNEPLRLRLARGARRRAEDFSIERRSRELLRLVTERTEQVA